MRLAFLLMTALAGCSAPGFSSTSFSPRDFASCCNGSRDTAEGSAAPLRIVTTPEMEPCEWCAR